jgi:hypothetical protein
LITGLEKRVDEKLAMSDPLVSWVLSQVEPWERWRDQEFKEKWEEYYRIWRGKWAAKDKERMAERSKIITPATQQAVEAQVAEMEESMFARKRWFEIEEFDPTGDPDIDEEGKAIIVEFLSDDMEHAGIKSVMTEALLNGALYGNPIIKITVEEVEEKRPIMGGGVQIEQKKQVVYSAVDPMNFVIDPAATNIDDSLGVAHCYVTPEHLVHAKQKQGIYEEGYIGSMESSLYSNGKDESKPVDEQGAEIIEWHGKVPRNLLNKKRNFMEEFHETDMSSELVEAIVIISNRSKRLFAGENPFIMKDRGFVSCQWDTVPNRFSGRGVVEKAYNAQKALDTEHRARIDSLALSTYPMTVVNTLMAPRSMDSRVTPGKRLAVNGSPKEAIDILKLPGPDANSYRHASDLERMVQMATGSVAPSSPIGVNPTNETASGMSMMMGAMFKRGKRTLRNIEENLVRPLIQKTAWRYMQFQPQRYPMADYRFSVYSGLGASAREFEIAQLSQFLQTMEPGSPEYWVIVRAMLNNFSLDAKDTLLGFVDQRLEAAQNPQPPQPTIDQQIEMQKLQLEQMKVESEILDKRAKLQLKAEETDAEAARDRGEAQWSESTAIANIEKMAAEINKLEAEAEERRAAAKKHLREVSSGGE